MKTKAVKWLNSSILCVHRSFAEEIKVAEGSTVDLTMEDGRLVIRVAPQPNSGRCGATLALRTRNANRDIAILDKLQKDERFEEVGWN